MKSKVKKRHFQILVKFTWNQQQKQVLYKMEELLKSEYLFKDFFIKIIRNIFMWIHSIMRSVTAVITKFK